MQSAKGLAALVLLVAWPFLHFAAQNAYLGVSYPRLLVTALGCLSLAILMILALAWAFRRIRFYRWTAVVGSGFVALFLFEPLALIMQEYGFFRYHQAAVYPSLVLVMIASVFLLSRSKEFVNKLLVVSIAINVFAFTPLVFDNNLSSVDSSVTQSQAGQNPTKAGGPLPNVYLLIFDEYARIDQLEKIFGIENEPFLQDLETRGFVVSRTSLANFPATILSVASTLSMNLIVQEGDVFNWMGLDNRRAKRIIDGYNNVVRRFRQLGYSYAHGGGESYVRCGNAEDLCIRAKSFTWMTEQERVLMLMTPFRLLRYRLKFQTEKFVPAVVGATLQRMSRKPWFMYAHFMVPRSPTYDKNCVTFGGLDGLLGPRTLPRQDPELMALRKAQYVTDIKCLNSDILELIDTILSSSENPVIIIQSDTGPTYLRDWKNPDWPEDEFLERYGILNAVRLPQHCRQFLYPKMTPVNIFRVVFACIEGKEPEYIDDVSILTSYYDDRPARIRREH